MKTPFVFLFTLLQTLVLAQQIMVDSIQTDNYTAVSCDSSATGPNGSIQFNVKSTPPEKYPYVPRVKLFVDRTVIEYDLFVLDRKPAGKIKRKGNEK